MFARLGPRLRPFGAAVLAALAVPAAGETITASPGPEGVGVTIYRDPERSFRDPMRIEWLNGFALISEMRRITIPAGDAQIRFEGVAGGIIPESAIVTGLPEGVVEKNQDADLLSPASLLDRSLGKRVHLRRTSRQTGEVREQDAIIRSGADGAVVLQTDAGFEALRCTGLPETLSYEEVPQGLSAKPTLSVRTHSSRASTATVTLSYLATGFDWQANYVATLAPSGDRMDLLAWVTLASGDETSFVGADTQTVAGRLNREAPPPRPPEPRPWLQLQCWPAATTSDISQVDSITAEDIGMYPAPPPPPPMMAMEAMQRVSGVAVSKFAARQEELGDLKLYRIPEPVTVASKSQKQVAMLEQPGVKVETFYRLPINRYSPEQPQRPLHILKARNRKQEGLGLPLPAGGVVLFGAGRERPVLLGEGAIDDRAIGEDVEIEFGEASGILARVVRISGDEQSGDYSLTVTNDQNRPVRFEAEFGDERDEFFTLAGRTKLGSRNGRPLWAVTVPAKGSAGLSYRLKERS